MELKVKDCNDCPFFNNDRMFCQHPDSNGNIEAVWNEKGIYILPDLCPLKKEPITVILAE